MDAQDKELILIWSLLAIIFIVLGGVAYYKHKQKKATTQSYLQNNANIVRIFCDFKNGVTSNSISVLSVDGQEAATFTNVFKNATYYSGVYVTPGAHELDLQFNFTSTVVLVISNSAFRSSYTGSATVNLQENKDYLLSFNSDTGEFSCAEFITPTYN